MQYAELTATLHWNLEKSVSEAFSNLVYWVWQWNF